MKKEENKVVRNVADDVYTFASDNTTSDTAPLIQAVEDSSSQKSLSKLPELSGIDGPAADTQIPTGVSNKSYEEPERQDDKAGAKDKEDKATTSDVTHDLKKEFVSKEPKFETITQFDANNSLGSTYQVTEKSPENLQKQEWKQEGILAKGKHKATDDKEVTSDHKKPRKLDELNNEYGDLVKAESVGVTLVTPNAESGTKSADEAHMLVADIQTSEKCSGNKEIKEMSHDMIGQDENKEKDAKTGHEDVVREETERVQLTSLVGSQIQSKKVFVPTNDLQVEPGESGEKAGTGSISVLDDAQKELNNMKPSSIDNEMVTTEGDEKKAEPEGILLIPPYSSEDVTEEKGDNETTSSDIEAGDTKDLPETKVSSEVVVSADNVEKDLDQSEVEKEESMKPESTTDIALGTNVDDTSQEKSLQNEQFTAEQVGISSREPGTSDELSKEMDDAQQVPLKEVSETAEPQTIKDDISKETDDVNIPESDLGQVTIDLETPKTEDREQGKLDGKTPTVMDDELQKDALDQSKGEIIDESQEPGELSEVLDNGSAGTKPGDVEVERPTEDSFDKDKSEAETASKEAEARSEDLKEEIGQRERKVFASVENGVGMLPDMAEQSEKESSSMLDDVQKELSDIKPSSIDEEVVTAEGSEKKADREEVSLIPPYSSENLTEEKGDTKTTRSDIEAGDTKDFPETKVSSEVDVSSDNMEKDLDQSEVEKKESVIPESTTDVTPGTNVDDTSQKKSLQNEQFTTEQVGISYREPRNSDELSKGMDDAQQVALKEISETAEPQTTKDNISRETDEVNIPESDLGQLTIDLVKPMTEDREQGQLDGETPTIMDDKLQKDAMEQSKGEIIDVSQEPGELSEDLDKDSAGTKPADFEVEGPAEDSFDKDKSEADTASKEAEARSEDLQEDIGQSEKKQFARENSVGMLPDMTEDLSEKESSSMLDDVQKELSDIKPSSIDEEVGTAEGNEKKLNRRGIIDTTI